MNSKNPGEVLKYVDFVAYTVYDAKIGNYVPIVELDKYLQVFKRVPYRIGPVALEDYPELVGDYPCDGLVLVSESGTTYKLKFNNDIKDTEVTSISWRTKGTGCIFPRIHYKTIRISDADCSNASGGSYHRLISNGYGPGAKISVVRSGEVIPTVLHAIDPVFTGIVPKCSYGCTTDPVIRGSHVYCSNPDCPAKNESTFQRLIQWKSPKGFTTEMRSFIEDFYVSYDELLKAIRRGELKDISGFTPGTPHQNQMIQETLTSLSNTESISLATLAFICEVNGFGDTIANNVSNYYKGHVHGSVMTPDLDPKVVNNSKASESWKLRYSVISKFLETFIVCEPTEKRLSIETVCISGSLDYGTKKLFDKEVVSRGFTQVGSVDSSCKYLISNELGTSKCKRANSLGIPILTEQEFLKLPIRS
jgi:NAD-dependent DNA ligase